jgi:predicted amidohydrolase YtcJ
MARSDRTLLIRDAEIWQDGAGGQRADVLIAADRIVRIERAIAKARVDRIIDARGGLLLPGLHDHHIHLAGLAVRAQSIWCGPPQVNTPSQLAECLAAAPGDGSIRAIGYHESVMDGLPDAAALDRLVPDRPLRMQHRSGRMWLLNSAARDAVLTGRDAPPGMEREGGRFTGRLFDEDDWLRGALNGSPPDFAATSADLARCGITGLTDMTPQNGADMAAHFAAQRRSGTLRQSSTLAGTLDLAKQAATGWSLGPVKLHLHEAGLPPFEDVVALIRAAHGQERAIAVHCVSEVELVFALAALEEAGTMPGDRIEHASVALPGHVAHMAKLGLAVCVQPHFVAERGDQYLEHVEPRLHGDLYRLASLRQAGLPLAGGSDAPFASADPWAAMRAAVSRTTAQGQVIAPDEALAPEQALSLWLADPADLARSREVAAGAAADLCLLRRPWAKARERLTSDDVALTLTSGRIIHDGIDQTPFKGAAR